jgi:hypothetical protein
MKLFFGCCLVGKAPPPKKKKNKKKENIKDDSTKKSCLCGACCCNLCPSLPSLSIKKNKKVKIKKKVKVKAKAKARIIPVFAGIGVYRLRFLTFGISLSVRFYWGAWGKSFTYFTFSTACLNMCCLCIPICCLKRKGNFSGCLRPKCCIKSCSCPSCSLTCCSCLPACLPVCLGGKKNESKTAVQNTKDKEKPLFCEQNRLSYAKSCCFDKCICDIFACCLGEYKDGIQEIPNKKRERKIFYKNKYKIKGVRQKRQKPTKQSKQDKLSNLNKSKDVGRGAPIQTEMSY